MIAASVALIGALLRKPWAMTAFPVVIVVMSFLLWFEYSLFFLLSAPFTVICNSRDAVINHQYSQADTAAFGLVTQGNLTVGGIDVSSLAVNPQTFLDSCRNGKPLFAA